jgi:putative acetyltransferase
MYSIIRTDSNHPEFQRLVLDLDLYLAEMDGEEHSFYNALNGIQSIKHVVLVMENTKAIGCGSFKEFDTQTIEIKRMWVEPIERGKGIASRILQELENWGAQMKYVSCILETGIRQVEAIELYRKNGYSQIENFGPYQGAENSVCFSKSIPVVTEQKSGHSEI